MTGVEFGLLWAGSKYKMVDEISPKVAKVLQDFSQKIKAGDNQEAKRATAKKFVSDTFDTNHDGKIDGGDDNTKLALLAEIMTAHIDSLGKDEKELLGLLIAAIPTGQPQKPPAPNLDKYGDRIKEELNKPHKLSNPAEDTFWRNDRLRYKGQTIDLDTNKALDYVRAALTGTSLVQVPGVSKETNEAIAVVHGLWENFDYTRERVVRMEELLGVSEYIKTLDNTDKTKDKDGETQQSRFKKAFFEQMGKYIKEKFGDDSQFTFDSLLALIQSTDWSDQDETTQSLKTFCKDLAEGIANTGDFAKNLPKGLGLENGAIVGNYNGKGDGNPYGSLSLIRYKEKVDGKEVMKFDWLEYETAPQENKTKYTFNKKQEQMNPAGAGFGGRLKETSGTQKPDSGQKQTLSDEQKQKLNSALNKAREKVAEILQKLPKPAPDKSVDPADAEIKTKLETIQAAINILIKDLDKKGIKSVIDELRFLKGQINKASEMEKLADSAKNDLKNIAKEFDEIGTEIAKSVEKQDEAKKVETPISKETKGKLAEVLKGAKDEIDDLGEFDHNAKEIKYDDLSGTTKSLAQIRNNISKLIDLLLLEGVDSDTREALNGIISALKNLANKIEKEDDKTAVNDIAEALEKLVKENPELSIKDPSATDSASKIPPFFKALTTLSKAIEDAMGPLLQKVTKDPESLSDNEKDFMQPAMKLLIQVGEITLDKDKLNLDELKKLASQLKDPASKLNIDNAKIQKILDGIDKLKGEGEK